MGLWSDLGTTGTYSMYPIQYYFQMDDPYKRNRTGHSYIHSTQSNAILRQEPLEDRRNDPNRIRTWVPVGGGNALRKPSDPWTKALDKVSSNLGRPKILASDSSGENRSVRPVAPRAQLGQSWWDWTFFKWGVPDSLFPGQQPTSGAHSCRDAAPGGPQDIDTVPTCIMFLPYFSKKLTNFIKYCM
jgi:hypothetical protein